MAEEKYNTKDIRHIDENSQEYIAEGNRMIKEIINSDGSRNWQANILLDNIKRLEQENKGLKEKIIELSEEKGHLIVENNTLKESNQSLSMLGIDLASANETVRKEFFRADKNKDMWREKAEEYRSALEEIKKVIKSYSLTVDNGASIDTLYTIRKIINEVLNDN